jgi:hypothetical protein
LLLLQPCTVEAGAHIGQQLAQHLLVDVPSLLTETCQVIRKCGCTLLSSSCRKDKVLVSSTPAKMIV